MRRHPTFHPLTVAHVDRLTDDAVAVTFDVPPELAEDYAFAHGQHLTLRCTLDGEDLRRNYSICAPAKSGPLRVAVKHLEGGAFSAFVNSSLRPGDVIDVMTPTGMFTTELDPTATKHYAAIVAGSGITPILSILSTVLDTEPHSTFTLLYGNRNTRSIMFLEELADLKDRYPSRFQMVNVLSREPQEVELLHGRLDREKLETLFKTLVDVDSVDRWFLCGPFAMVEDARATLLDHGVEPRQIHSELFHVDGTAPRQVVVRPESADPGSASTVTIVLDGRASTFPLASDAEPILDATLKIRADAPYACKGGVCGTCRAKVEVGEVVMERCYALDPEEVENGYVLACQSHPVTDEVTLNFDV